MYQSIQLKKATPLFLVLFVLACFALSPRAQAVSPPPDGGYPGGNTAEGQKALSSLTTGGFNVADGYFSLFANTTGSFNTAVGAGALDLNTADNNTATGAAALLLNTTGTQNTAVGTDALVHNDSGSDNSAVGAFALFNNTTGNDNTALGAEAGIGVTTASNVICIGTGGNNVSDSCYIGNIFGATSSGGAAVFVSSDGRLGTVVSSQRFKDDIKPMDKASEALFELRPVTFRYKKEIDPAGIAQFGLLAEEVQKSDPDLVVRDKDGKVNTVRYDQVNAMLLNEFLKEHRKVQELEANSERQQKQIEALTAGLQKVSAQLEVSKPAPRMVENDQ
jgi:hypothetical protein